MKKIGLLGWICQILVLIGALNWGLVGALKIDLVSKIFGYGTVTRVIYIIVGLAAVFLIIDLLTPKKKVA
ncbi:MAG: DUF378 domain-containing protein [Candidatus Aminicenantes bacterium]|nr:DUF378 domain-containing protein [Candidatus Aminicenantes bacterium]